MTTPDVTHWNKPKDITRWKEFNPPSHCLYFSPGGLVKLLARHGLTVSVDVLSSGGNTVGDTLKQHSLDVGAELLVMGAYGHSRLRERIFGGVTRSMIEDVTLPVFWGR